MENEYKIMKEWKQGSYACKVLFVHGSHFCGYVGIPKRHPAYGLEYDDVPVSVHGGLTYGDYHAGKDDKSKKFYYLGFDCAHAGDHNWTLEEVVKETKDLVNELNSVTWQKIVEHKLEYMPDWFKQRVKVNIS